MKKKRVACLFLSLGLMLSPINAESSHQIPVNKLTEHHVHSGVISAINVGDVIKETERISKFEDGYTTTGVNIRKDPHTDAEILKTVEINTKIKYLKTATNWTKVIYNNIEGYIFSEYISDKKTEIKPVTPQVTQRAEVRNNGNHLTRRSGVFWYNSRQRESYYNLNMSGVVRIMRRAGFSEAQYPYWVRSDGCKMLGDYIMVAANLSIYPRGSIINTSLGKAIVADTGTFIYNFPYGVDVATTW